MQRNKIRFLPGTATFIVFHALCILITLCTHKLFPTSDGRLGRARLLIIYLAQNGCMPNRHVFICSAAGKSSLSGASLAREKKSPISWWQRWWQSELYVCVRCFPLIRVMLHLSYCLFTCSDKAPIICENPVLFCISYWCFTSVAELTIRPESLEKVHNRPVVCYSTHMISWPCGYQPPFVEILTEPAWPSCATLVGQYTATSKITQAIIMS